MRRFLLLLSLPTLTALVACNATVIGGGVGGTGTGASTAGTGASTAGTGASTTSSTCTSTWVVCEIDPGSASHLCTEACGPLVSPTCSGYETQVSSCPTANVLGTCYYTPGGGTDWTVTVYYVENGTAAEAQMGCEAIPGAVWTTA